MVMKKMHMTQPLSPTSLPKSDAPKEYFWKIYLCTVCLLVGSIQIAEWRFPVQAPKMQVVQQIIISIPPKPEGVQENTSGGNGDFIYTEEGCAKQPEQFVDICLHQLARQKAQTDLVVALDVCDRLQKEEQHWECYSDSAELYASTNRDVALEVCPTIGKKKWKDQCVFGIALVWSTQDSPWAFALCEQAGQWRDFCRHDVNGEISVVNLDLALEHCGREEGDLLTRKSCWHGIGKYIARVDVDRAFQACDRVPSGPSNLYKENCYHGLGWGASETAEESFMAQCERAGEEKSSCLLGIAYNLRRFDIDRGLRICQTVPRLDLQEQCLRFVSNGRL